MFYDDLPVWGFLGKVEKLVKTGKAPVVKYYLFTHFHFELSYNDDRIIEINVSSDPMRTVDITDADKLNIQFSYSVKWKATSIPYEHRMDRYSRYSFLPQHLEVNHQCNTHILATLSHITSISVITYSVYLAYIVLA